MEKGDMSFDLPENVAALRCCGCGFTTGDFWQWACPECPPEYRMDVVYKSDSCEKLAAGLAQRPFNMWRYREVLPIPTGATLPPLHTGGTPIYEAPRLAKELGVARVVVKDDGRGPSASLKDRPSAMAVMLAMASGAQRIVCASTGNAASSLAAHAASVGLPATIFVPRRAPEPKIAQLRIFGAQVFRVDADYDRTWELCAEVAASRPWFNRNCAVNPYLVEGKKTVGLELAEQLGESMTDWVVLTVGDGCTIAGAVKGLEEACRAGLIPSVPRVLGVQAQGAAPLVEAANSGKPWQPGPAETLADSISVGHARNPYKALDAVKRANGGWVAVSDEAILAAIATTGVLSGVFAEPAAAAATAGVHRARDLGLIDASESAAIVVSGNGLKDTASALLAVDGPIDVQASTEAVLAQLEVNT